MTTAGTIPVKIFMEDERGCRNTQMTSLTGYAKPEADFYWSPLTPKEQVEDVTFKDASKGEGIVKWNWYIQKPDGGTDQGSGPVIVKNYEKAGDYVVVLIVENAGGCLDTVIKAIHVEEDVVYYVPDAFTPNGDGINDVFGPKGYGPFTFKLTVYDRWGEKLFTSTKLNEGWDGTYRGAECKSDVYVWKLEVTLPGGKKETKTGHVTLLK
jgi:gliding motility-associated-like protein